MLYLLHFTSSDVRRDALCLEECHDSDAVRACRMQSQRGGRDVVLLEDGAAPGVRVSRGPVHGHPHPERLSVWALSGSPPLPDQTTQRLQTLRPEPQDHVTNSFFRRSSSHALCSPPVCLNRGGAAGSATPDETWCPKKCGALNLTLASVSCLSREHVAIKTVRVPEVGDLRTLTEDPRLDLRIVHLVRDPRAVLASRMMAFSDQFRTWKIWNATGRQPRYVDLTQITSTCKDMAASAETGLQRPTWLRERYLLVRYEDLPFNPRDKAAEIYRFVGLEMEDRVRIWIANNTKSNASSPSEWNYRYSTARDSRATSESWRLRLGFDIVRAVQNLCNDTLALLGYKQVHSAAELRNLSHSLVERRTFQPTW
uniref:Sulfotransferase n=1 Tax=Gasterosteus aculeatus aculeatus TaxID=481459 RepID=A0AAQ4RST7_GASAC|nr:carbohydrate sulfotransferase 1-like [Gasterosteus aculeatus aculeatus]